MMHGSRPALRRAASALAGRRPLSLHGATVLVTGGASGIGRLIALGAARRGAGRVVVWDLDLQGAEAVAAEIRSQGADARAERVDVTDAAAVEAAAARAGEVDVAVNNAGVVTGARLEDATEEGIRRTFEVNALAPYWLTRAVLPGMRARDRGAVVTVASAAGLVGVARQTDYSATKHAAVGFAESLAAELRGLWNIETDDSGAIGRRYRRQDEIGTPFCITVDFDTLEDQAVTIRERDTMAQERVALSQVKSYLLERLVK